MLDLIDTEYALVDLDIQNWMASQSGTSDAGMTMLQRYISAASAQVQNFLGIEYTQAQIDVLNEDIKMATLDLVKYKQANTGTTSNLQSETLGPWSYDKGRGFSSTYKPLPYDIMAILAPYRVVPTMSVIKSDTWTTTSNPPENT